MTKAQRIVAVAWAIALVVAFISIPIVRQSGFETIESGFDTIVVFVSMTAVGTLAWLIAGKFGT